MRKRERLLAGEPKMDWKCREDQEKNYASILRKYHMPMVFSNKQYKAWTLEYYKKNKRIHKSISVVKDEYFRSIGAECRLLSRENGARYEWLSDKQKNYLEEHTFKLITLAVKTRKEAKKEENQINLETTVIKTKEKEAMFESIICEFDRNIDNLGKGGKRINPAVYISSMKVPVSVLKRVSANYQPLLDEVSQVKRLTKKHMPRCDKDGELINDSSMVQLYEGYEGYTRKDIDNTIDYVTSIINACRQGSITTTKVKKSVPVTTILNKIQYLKEFTELKLTSVHPRKLLNNPNEVWVYNTKRKRIAKYVSTDGDSITVKGTTLKNFDIEKSLEAVISKPKEYFKDLKMTKRPLAAAQRQIKNKISTPTGRINKDCIILAVF